MKTTIAQTITFGIDGDAEAVQICGWSGPEHGMTWICEEKAEIVVNLPEAVHGLLLEASVCPFAYGPALPSQRLNVEIGGVVFAEEVAPGACTLAWRVPRATPAGPATITFRCPDCSRPSDVGANTDERRLGFCFEYIRILVAVDAPIAFSGTPRSDVALAGSTSFALRSAIEAMTGIEATQFIREFVSLIGNCEFGFFQRHMSAEIMSLLSFAGAYPLLVERGIRTLFAGIGEDCEQVEVVPHEGGDWAVRDLKFDLWYHSWTRIDALSAEEMKIREAKRLRFLGRKFRDTVESASRIFVCRDVFKLPESEVLAIFLTLNRIGESKLLWVVDDDDALAPGSAREVVPGLVKARIAGFAPNDSPGEAPLSAWSDVCVNGWWVLTKSQAARRALLAPAAELDAHRLQRSSVP